MDGEKHDLQLKLRRSGEFNERRVDGWQYEKEHGKLTWHIKTWLTSGSPIEEYWIEGGEFYEVLGKHYAVNMQPVNHIETGRMIVEIDPIKRETILNAIAEWEKAEVEGR
jgi:hypothetical protein